MARKSFLKGEGLPLQNDPALAFLSPESVTPVEKKPDVPTEIPSPARRAESPKPKTAAGSSPDTPPMRSPQHTPPAPTIPQAPKGYKLNPLFVETKTRKIQLSFRPSVYERVKAASVAAGLSFNEYCHRVLERAASQSQGEPSP